MSSDESRVAPDSRPGRVRTERSVAGLLSDLANETGMLVRQEVALFKAELQEKFRRMGRGAGAAAAGALIVVSGWLVLLAAAVLALSIAVEPWLAALIVGVVVLLLGVTLLWFGKTRLDADTLVPRRTLNSLREDEAWIRDHVS